jgi:hypothetical protein
VPVSEISATAYIATTLVSRHRARTPFANMGFEFGERTADNVNVNGQEYVPFVGIRPGPCQPEIEDP